jgi:hypothetical protein
MFFLLQNQTTGGQNRLEVVEEGKWQEKGYADEYDVNNIYTCM